MYLEDLFKYLRKNKNPGMTSLSFDEIERIIHHKLSPSLKEYLVSWQTGNVGRLASQYGIEVVSINAVTEYVNFKVL